MRGEPYRRARALSPLRTGARGWERGVGASQRCSPCWRLLSTGANLVPSCTPSPSSCDACVASLPVHPLTSSPLPLCSPRYTHRKLPRQSSLDIQNICSILLGKRHSEVGLRAWAVPSPAGVRRHPHPVPLDPGPLPVKHIPLRVARRQSPMDNFLLTTEGLATPLKGWEVD